MSICLVSKNQRKKAQLYMKLLKNIRRMFLICILIKIRYVIVANAKAKIIIILEIKTRYKEFAERGYHIFWETLNNIIKIEELNQLESEFAINVIINLFIYSV